MLDRPWHLEIVSVSQLFSSSEKGESADFLFMLLLNIYNTNIWKIWNLYKRPIYNIIVIIINISKYFLWTYIKDTLGDKKY